MPVKDEKNVVVFEHLIINNELSSAIRQFIGDQINTDKQNDITRQLTELFKDKLRKYSDKGVGAHIKLVYFFLVEGMIGAVEGKLLNSEIENQLKAFFKNIKTAYPKKYDHFILIGISELSQLLAVAESNLRGTSLKTFLLGANGRGGYDTPKFAAALLQLARRDYARQELFLRFDDDVIPSVDGLKNIKQLYHELVNAQSNPHFCFSWKYETSGARNPDTIPFDYNQYFNYFVNFFSIRTTFLGDASCRCFIDPLTLECKSVRNPEDPALLNLTHAKYFIELFQFGKWGSNLKDVISGAGMCYSPDSLLDLPPWTNADQLVVWIDDFIKAEVMAVVYEDRFSYDEMKKVMESSSAGFIQDRNKPDNFKVKDVQWATETYLDRLIMGIAMCFAVNPRKFNVPMDGFAEVLKEKNYLVAWQKWQDGIRAKLEHLTLDHVCKVLCDWHNIFCVQSTQHPAGYLAYVADGVTQFTSSEVPRPPDGFVPAPADTFFNAYVLKQLVAIQGMMVNPSVPDQILRDKQFALVNKVFIVLDNYLKLKFQFWPVIVKVVDHYREQFITAPASLPQALSWLFHDLSALGKPTLRPYERKSSASYAIFEPPKSKKGVSHQGQCLLQWNPNWKVMNFIGGHREETDANDLMCIMREIHEELFNGLSVQKTEKLKHTLQKVEKYTHASNAWQDPYIKSVKKSKKPPHDFPPFVEFSGSKKQWTRYELKIYTVELTYDGWKEVEQIDTFYTAKGAASPKAPVEWVSRQDIERGWTQMGRPISKTVNRILNIKRK